LPRVNTNNDRSHIGLQQIWFFEGNRVLMKSIQKQRRKIIHRNKQRCQLILMVMRYHETQMVYKETIIKSVICKIETKSLTNDERSWEGDYKRRMKVRQQNSQNDVTDIGKYYVT
jgi:hypothetical protein